MSIVQFQMKVHSRETVTAQFPGLNDCVVHGCQPTIQKIVYGRAKYTSYVMHCQHEDCGRCTDDPRQVVDIWNKWNSKIETAPAPASGIQQ